MGALSPTQMSSFEYVSFNKIDLIPHNLFSKATEVIKNPLIEFNFYTECDTLHFPWIADNPMAINNCYFQGIFGCFAKGKLALTLVTIMPASCQFDFPAPLGPLGCKSEEILYLK